MNRFASELFSYQELELKKFCCKLIPNIPEDSIIGVRSPVIKKLIKKFKDDSYCEEFLNTLPHDYLEEYGLHCGLLNYVSKDINVIFDYVDKILPYVNNWATCDSFDIKIYDKYLDRVMEKIEIWIKSEHVYTIRYAVGLLMKYYLDDLFNKKHFKMINSIKNDDYYVKMMIAWYYSVALVKQYDITIKLIESKTLDKWIHNKSIQKALESYRITDEQKEYLRTLKIK